MRSLLLSVATLGLGLGLEFRARASILGGYAFLAVVGPAMGHGRKLRR